MTTQNLEPRAVSRGEACRGAGEQGRRGDKGTRGGSERRQLAAGSWQMKCGMGNAELYSRETGTRGQGDSEGVG